MTRAERRKILLTHVVYFAAVAALYAAAAVLILAMAVAFDRAIFTPGGLGFLEVFVLGLAGPALYDILRAAARWAERGNS